MRLDRGASLGADGSVRFAVWAPRAERVSVVVSGAHPGEWPLTGDEGAFTATVPDVGAGAEYVYRLEGPAGAVERADPVSRHQPRGVHGPSAVVDPSAFRWSDAAWRAPALPDLVLYELHVGTFTAAGTFDAVVPELPALRDLGVTAIELMPVGEFPGARNWGYDGVHLYAPQSTYGGPDGLRRLVDAAHAAGLAVVLDVVYNHIGPEGNHLADFGPYFTDRYRTPWGPAVNFDGPDSDEVRRWIVDNALHWVREFHVDGLRLDAVHAIYDFSARHIVEELASAVHAEGERLGRRVHVIAESDLNDPRLVRVPDRGGHGLDAQWSDDFHHAVHVALTEERDGYYADFGGVAPIAKALRDRFVYDGRYSVHRRRRHGAPAGDLPAERFVVFAQNHDQVGNRARGDRLASLVPPARLRLATALVLLSPYVPLLFMGEEYGERNPFLYFVDHDDPDLIRAVREGRRREFETLGWGRDVPDPQAVETFLRSRLDRTHADTGVRALHRDCLRLRREEAALRPGGAAVRVAADPTAGWVTVTSTPAAGAVVTAAFNLSDAQDVPLPRPPCAPWTVALSTDAERYGGAGAPTPVRADGERLAVGVPAWSALLLRVEPR